MRSEVSQLKEIIYFQFKMTTHFRRIELHQLTYTNDYIKNLRYLTLVQLNFRNKQFLCYKSTFML